MTEEELIYYSKQFGNMFGIPIRVYKERKLLYSYSTINLETDPINLCIDEIMGIDSEVGYYIYHDVFYYGIVNHNNYKAAIGPVSELKSLDNELRKIGFLLNIAKDNISYFVSEMKSLLGIHMDTLIQALILYNFTLNKTMYDISDIRIKNDEQNDIHAEIKSEKIFSDTNFYDNHIRSFSIEKDIIKKITNGDVEGLIDGATKVPAVSSGQLAQNLLRHQKNFFIRLETIVSRAAIEAGLDIDEVFETEEMYIVKCESLDNVDRIKNLQYHMIIDYADRVKKHKQYNENNSKLVNDTAKYIRAHISEAIKTSDIAQHFGKSRGNFTTEFKKQTGINLSDFIKLKKIQEAKELLCETNKELQDISYYLGFSSQSHFCRIFKDITGITPNEYRNKKSNRITNMPKK